MKCRPLLLAVLLFNTSPNPVPAQTAPRCPLGDDWVFRPELSDEFDGDALDQRKWWDFNPSWHGRKPAFFSRENVAVRGGRLHLTARVQSPEEVTVENRVRGYDKFTTATVKSKRRVRYGYFEARCKAMRANVCNAFWLYDPLDPPAKYQEGSFSEEIDIFEVFGKPAKPDMARVLYMTLHRMATPYVESLVVRRTALTNHSARVQMPFEFWEDFHVYALLWTPRELRWYVDGREVFARGNDHFTTALHIMFDCEVMESWAGLPDPADLPATFEIDYLRVWQPGELVRAEGGALK
ncbi:MAG: family 16 glycosylhydrolase [Kiritimatiellae bacterium]|nr:family 16 glycosylhydrolase [Kiritimatiellia bacterium]